MDKIVIVTGGFDPIHSGHISYIKDAKNHGRVLVGLNSDDWLTRKKGSSFMQYEEREMILKNLKDVMGVISFDDSDNTACDAIIKAKEMFPNNKIVFANGGDRTKDNIPEMEKFKDDSSVEFLFEVGGNTKKNSSSTILNNWKYISETRPWGKFITYYVADKCKVKRLEIDPGKSISMQYHIHRNEFWFVEYGTANVYTLSENEQKILLILNQNDTFTVPQKSWHRLENSGTEVLSVIEIQFGEECIETDITRLNV